MKLYEATGLSFKDGIVGIELEVEANRPFGDAPPTGWVAKPDGSLRGNYNMEFVSNGPISANKLDDRITKLCSFIKPSDPQHSSRTSLHVHVNCLDMETTDVWSGLLFALLVEPSLMGYVDPCRRANKFCSPFGYSYAMNLSQAAKYRAFSFDENRIKYTAIAPHNLSTLGTIEFRLHQGTNDPAKISYWSRLCNSIVNTPIGKWKNPEEMFEHFVNTDCSDILTHFDHGDKLKLNQEATYDNMIMLLNMATETDWSTEPKKRAKVGARLEMPEFREVRR